MRAGWNALDAAVAAAATLTVVYPHNCALGGDVIALVAKPDGTVVTVNGSGAAPAAASAGTLRAEHKTMPFSGAATVTVPGAVAAWEAILSLGGRRTLPQALEAAISAAAEGVPIARSLAVAIEGAHAGIGADEGLAQLFLDNGRPRREGATQPRGQRHSTAERSARPSSRRLQSLGSSMNGRC